MRFCKGPRLCCEAVERPDAQGPNSEQIRYWNDDAGSKWVELQERLDAQLESLGRRAMDRAAIARDERVLDVGCGCGATAIELAERVGPRGHVAGVDLSAVMLERARARGTGLAQLRFEVADAQTHGFPERSFHSVYSRFGMMFFAQPEAAFANLRAALREGGRLAFVCWRSLADNPWMSLPIAAVAKQVPLPPPPAPDAPGPLAFADAERVRGILERAGFADVAFESVDETLTLGGGGDLDETVEFMLRMGPVARVLRDADPACLPRAAAAVREALSGCATPDGVRMGSGAWVVSGRRPDSPGSRAA